jgi:hypothetical protein
MKKSSLLGILVLLAATFSTASASALTELRCNPYMNYEFSAIVDENFNAKDVKINGVIRHGGLLASAKLDASWVDTDENGRPTKVRIRGGFHPAAIARWMDFYTECDLY